VEIDSAELTRRADLRAVAKEAWDIFHERYVDNPAIDWLLLRTRFDRRRVTSEEELHDTIDWLLSQAGDQFTRFLSPSELSSMKDDVEGVMCGVGIVFTAETHGWRRTKRVVVKEVVGKSPAAEAGLSRGDEITAIDTSSIRRMSIDDATSRLLGKDGDKVSVSFIRCDDDVELSVTLTRRRFDVPTVSGEPVLVPGVGRVGFIQVREFAANTGLQARRAVRRLIKTGPVDAFVIDLRNNSGGLVDQAVEFAKVFLEREHVVVRFVGRGDIVTTESSDIGWFCRSRVRVPCAPVVILVDETTASASELVAAALRDNCRAVIVGASTYGKGSVQAIAQLSDGSGVAITVARYRTPSNSPIRSGRGLRPDLYKPDLADDVGAVMQLLGRSPRRFKWVQAKLSLCAVPQDAFDAAGLGRLASTLHPKQRR
jgi:carboxyl-terminal processing protease